MMLKLRWIVSKILKWVLGQKKSTQRENWVEWEKEEQEDEQEQEQKQEQEEEQEEEQEGKSAW